MQFSIDNRYIAIDLLASEDRYILWITAVPLTRRRLQSGQHVGRRMCDTVTVALSCSPNLRSESDHRYAMLLLLCQPITLPRLYLLSVTFVLQSAIIMKDRIFFTASVTSYNLPFFLVITLWRNGPMYLYNGFCVPCAPKICFIKYPSQLISTIRRSISVAFEELGPVVAFQ